MTSKISKDKKDKFGVSRNDIVFSEGDYIHIPMNLYYTHKQYTGKHFMNIKEKYKGKRAKVKDILFMFNSFWRVNFETIDTWNENQSEWHMCFVVADFIGCSTLRKSNKQLYGLLEIGGLIVEN